MAKYKRSLLLPSLAVTLFVFLGGSAAASERIKPCKENPYYWEYKGKPVLLLGGSKDDNLFQLPALKKHLEEMQRVGANYIRNTMSDRQNKGFELYPFKRIKDGKYDLRKWNQAYWERFRNMLKWTNDRDIVVQIEMWDRFDYSDHRGSKNWLNHPYNPRNNINYTHKESRLAPTYKRHPGANEQPFFFTVPELQNNRTVLRYQKAFVDKMLSYSLKYPNVLYCIDNETSGRAQWSRYWAEYIRKRARKAGVEVHATEMWDAWNLKDPTHRRTFDHPSLYSFVDVSQNNHNSSQTHWDNLQWVREYISKKPRPINTVKIYGADTGHYGTTRDGLERFWRNALGGVAATRFHRPDSGLGLSAPAKAHIKSMRLFTSKLDIFSCVPDSKGRLLSKRSKNEAYLTYNKGKMYGLYFPNGGSVKLDLGHTKGTFAVTWLDIAKCKWTGKTKVQGGKRVTLAAPSKGHWACVLERL